jgi:hypothetical protein
MRDGGGRGGGRPSDIALKHDIHLLGRLDNGLGFYRLSYNGSDEVQAVMPNAVFYDKLGVPFQTYDQWIASGAQIPARSEH